MIYQKPDKKNIFYNIWRNIVDSGHGLAILFRESGTVRRLIPLEMAGGLLFGLLSGFTPLEYILLAVTLAILLTTETLNTAIEEVNDLVTLEENVRVQRSKDLASGAVALWHLIYVLEAFFFLGSHLAGFAWWQHILPSPCPTPVKSI